MEESKMTQEWSPSMLGRHYRLGPTNVRTLFPSSTAGSRRKTVDINSLEARSVLPKQEVDHDKRQRVLRKNAIRDDAGRGFRRPKILMQKASLAAVPVELKVKIFRMVSSIT